jgi:hypothetical protein
MLTDTSVTAAHMAYGHRLRFAEHEHLLTPYPTSVPWRTVRLSR